MNCFQFVIWRSLTHPIWDTWITWRCCELLSICDLTIFDTPSSALWNILAELWIAFNLWFDDLWHTFLDWLKDLNDVVNCFQFVIWRSLTHLWGFNYIIMPRCELLSICDLTIFDTPVNGLTLTLILLWIAFNLWFDDLWHTCFKWVWCSYWVVNCFQFVIWRSLTHQNLSSTNSPLVVNCFQFVIWRSLTHLILMIVVILLCCELLSICDLTIFDTPGLLYWINCA